MIVLVDRLLAATNDAWIPGIFHESILYTNKILN